MALSKTQVDRLGERLRRGPVTEDHLRLLDEYRSSFDSAYDTVIRAVRRATRRRPSGRPRKTTDSIIAKLRRESIRLSQMQDIAGCRLVVSDLKKQDEVIAKLAAVFPERSLADRRNRPSHGYRAVHVIAYVDGKPLEIQVRTKLQDAWALVSETMSDTIDRDLKYGGGPEADRRMLDQLSQLVYHAESGKLKPQVAMTFLRIFQRIFQQG